MNEYNFINKLPNYLLLKIIFITFIITLIILLNTKHYDLISLDSIIKCDEICIIEVELPIKDVDYKYITIDKTNYKIEEIEYSDPYINNNNAVQKISFSIKNINVNNQLKNINLLFNRDTLFNKLINTILRKE